MSGVIICWLLAALTLSCESAHQPLNSINDLKRIDFGRSVPRHSLLLLYWFANAVNIDNRNTITVNFDPNADFGSHYYGNSDNRLSLPWGCRYYTVGNLYGSTSNELPGYLRSSNPENRDRIIFSAERQQYPGRAYIISHVYLTQHEPNSNDYDPYHTYQVSINLLRELRGFLNPTALLNCILDTPYYVQQSGSTRDTYLQSSSSNNGAWGGIFACIAFVLMLIVIMFLLTGLITTFAPKK